MKQNDTHNPDLKSWVDSANDPETDFPIQNLPFGAFKSPKNFSPHLCVAIGNYALDLTSVMLNNLLDVSQEIKTACTKGFLNQLMALGNEASSELRRALSKVLRSDAPKDLQEKLKHHLFERNKIEMLNPVRIGDFTDFYASIYHATNVGTMLRPENPLLPNYKYVPIAYHGRASSIVISGRKIRRPNGQINSDDKTEPKFMPSRRLDYEAEIGFFVGTSTGFGQMIPIRQAETHIWGACIVNDWSARDIQRWEYQPLGPFLSKNFATSVSPWVVTLEALSPFRANAFVRGEGEPKILPHLYSPENAQHGGLDITLEVFICTNQMHKQNLPPFQLSKGSFKDMYWTPAQMLTHHASNGCNFHTGDLFASGTVSGKTREEAGCLLERAWRGESPIELPTGEKRSFIEDGDEIIIKAYCEKEGVRRIGFGECTGIIIPPFRVGK
ncbi:MAG: fumarylacetoacetase [Chloroherpetonaceae bacterium]